MVRRAFQAVYQEIRGLHQAAYVLAVFAFGSQILALVRDRLLAHNFGAGIDLDIYYAAFRIPDLLFVVFSSTLSVYVLIPFVSKRLSSEGSTRAASALLSQIFSLFLILYAVLAVAVAVAAPLFADTLFPGFSDAEQEQLIVLMRILLIQPFLLGISSLFGVVTQIGQRFALYAVSPLLYNVGIIIGITVFYPIMGLSGLAWGVVVGACAHVAVQLPFVRKNPLQPHLTMQFEWREMIEVLETSVTRAVTLSLHQVVFLVLVGAASVMAAGSVSVFQFAFNLQSVPLAIIGVSYSVAAFPTLAGFFAKREYQEFIHHVTTALRHIIFWSLPAIALIVVIRAQIVRVILGSGAFDWDDTRLTAAALSLFVLSLVAQAVNLLVVRAFYAGGNTRTPLFVTVGSSLGALGGAYLFHLWFTSSVSFAAYIESALRVEGVPGTEVLMLPLGYSLAMMLHTIVLLALFVREHKMPARVLFQSLFRAFGASFLGGVIAYAVLNVVVEGIRTDTLAGIFLQGFIAGVCGIITIIITYYLLRSPELIEAWHSIHRRIFKTTRVVLSQDVDDLAT